MCYINDRARANGIIATTRPELDEETGQKVYDFYCQGELIAGGFIGRPAAYSFVCWYEERKDATNTTPGS